MDEIENTPSGGEGEVLSLEARMDATMSEAFDNATAEPSARLRDEQSGRFTSANKEEIAEAPEASAVVDGDQGEEASEAEPTDPTLVATRAPASWSPAAKAAFEAADPAIQAEVLKREADINKALQTHAEERKQFTGLQQVLASRAETLVEEHGSVEQGINDLFKISDFAAEKPAEFVKWFAQQRGVDLNQFVTGQPGQTPSDPLINGLMQKVQAFEQLLTAAQVEQARIAEANANRQIEAFKGTRPHFDAVRIQMGKLIDAGLAEGLEDAYDMAVHANPATRKQILDTQAKERADAASKEAAEKAARARKAAGTNIRANGAPTSLKPGPRSIEQTMSEVYDRAMGS